MKRILSTICCTLVACQVSFAQTTSPTATPYLTQTPAGEAMKANTFKLIWHDEFDGSGPFDNAKWQSETGFVRNEEDQWYQADNAFRDRGLLVLEGRIDSIPNPGYRPHNEQGEGRGNRRRGGGDWRSRRPYAHYSSGSINTRKSFSFLYGVMEVRARIPAVDGSWPAIWTLGTKREWPSNGECDVMEFYHIQGVPHILANAAWGNDQHYQAVWNTKRVPYQHFLDKDAGWGEKFHVWTMDWTPEYIRIYLDGELLNDIDLSKTINGSVGEHDNPFHAPQYILLNLAIGGQNGGHIQPDAFPMRYEVDYVRVWQRK